MVPADFTSQSLGRNDKGRRGRSRRREGKRGVKRHCLLLSAWRRNLFLFHGGRIYVTDSGRTRRLLVLLRRWSCCERDVLFLSLMLVCHWKCSRRSTSSPIQTRFQAKSNGLLMCPSFPKGVLTRLAFLFLVAVVLHACIIRERHRPRENQSTTPRHNNAIE